MALIITITDVKAKKWEVDIDRQTVAFFYQLVDETGKEVKVGAATFWVTLPPVPGPEDYLLPSSYIAQLLSLTNDAETAIKNRKGI